MTLEEAEEYSEQTDSDVEAEKINEQKKNPNVIKKDIINLEGLKKKEKEMEDKLKDTILRKCNKREISIVDHMSITSDKKFELKEVDVNDDI